MNQKILIVDDDVNFTKAISRTLKQEGYETTIANSGFDAGVSMGIDPPDLITLDLNMPQMSGSAVLELIKGMDNFKAVKILVISAATKAYMEQMLEKGADDYLVKPFDNAVLLEKVAKLLKR